MSRRKRSKLVAGGDRPINVLWRCHDCGLPRIDSTCPLCGHVQRFSYIRIAKLDAGGLSDLARELAATLTRVQRELAKTQITQGVRAGPIDRSRTSPSRNGSDVGNLGASITALLSELTVCGRRLADAKGRRVGQVQDRNRRGGDDRNQHSSDSPSVPPRIQLNGRRPVGLCAGCGKPAIIARDRMCEACLLARGYRRCPDCGVPCRPGSFGSRGICAKCLRRGRPKPVSVKAVSGGLPTLGRRH